MVQMTAADQAIVKALPGNSICADCDVKNPQWASVPFGIVFCLECSGVHRSLGVHISFVRSIAMDSWTPEQLKLMKGGGNDKFNSYLKQKGIERRTPIKQKYESDAAQLYKHVLKARLEGKPEPTVLPKPAPRSGGAGVTRSPASGGGGGGSKDPNGMERLPGETDQQYIARQTRLREEAKARMAAKFGSQGMGGVGSGGRSTMQGMGSDPHYNPNASSKGGGFDMDSLMSGLGSAVSSAGAVASSVKSSVLSEENMSAMRSTTSSFWGSLTAGVSTVAGSVTAAPESDGLADLQRQVAMNKPMQSKYGGFGSASVSGGAPAGIGSGSATPAAARALPASPASGGATLQEAQGLPGEDRNGIERLTGETDDQYVMRQTRLRDEARARMAAKFGGQSMSSASSSNMGRSTSPTPHAAPTSGGFGGIGGGGGGAPSAAIQEAPGLPGEDRNGIERLTGESDDQYVARQTRLREEARARMAAKFGGGGAKLSSAGSSNSAPPSGNTGTSPSWLSQPAPSSGNAVGLSAQRQQPVKSGPPSRSSSGDNKSLNADDFFSSFGT